jgi:hypothetical protein
MFAGASSSSSGSGGGSHECKTEAPKATCTATVPDYAITPGIKRKVLTCQERELNNSAIAAAAAATLRYNQQEKNQGHYLVQSRS